MEDDVLFEPQAHDGNILDALMHSQRQDLYMIPTHSPGSQGRLPLPDDTRLWAALQAASGGIWRGAVYDVDRITKVIEAGMQALGW
jgi:hypothetical protein